MNILLPVWHKPLPSTIFKVGQKWVNFPFDKCSDKRCSLDEKKRSILICPVIKKYAGFLFCGSVVLSVGFLFFFLFWYSAFQFTYSKTNTFITNLSTLNKLKNTCFIVFKPWWSYWKIVTSLAFCWIKYLAKWAKRHWVKLFNYLFVMPSQMVFFFFQKRTLSIAIIMFPSI